jgi:hypothetical protein
LEEFAPEIVYIKGIHNMVADAISQLEYNPEVNPTSKFNYSTFGIPAKGETIANGQLSQNSGAVITKTTQAIKQKNATSMKCLQIVARKRRSFTSPLQRLQRHKRLTANSNIAPGATQN